jgi:hypothetical protein
MKRVENRRRVERLMRLAIARLDLDLREISVLTEAASGNFVVTSLLAAMAGSSHIVALTADSFHGSAAEVANYVLEWARDLGIAERIEIAVDRTRAANAGCNIVTNLGFVRPIDATFIDRMPSDSMVALMWEPWEFRPEDIDLPACNRRKIPVLGTCESDRRVGTYRYVGLIVLKLLLENEIEVYDSDILVVGSSPFLEPTVRLVSPRACVL